MCFSHITRLAIIAMLTLCHGICPAADEQPGLHQGGTEILKDGKPWRGIGVNYVDAFMNSLGNPASPATAPLCTCRSTKT